MSFVTRDLNAFNSELSAKEKKNITKSLVEIGYY